MNGSRFEAVLLLFQFVHDLSGGDCAPGFDGLQLLAHLFADDFSAEPLLEFIDSQQSGISRAVIPTPKVENFQAGSLVVHYGFPNEQTVGASDFSLSFLGGSVGIERSRMEATNAVAFAIENMISLTFPGGRISRPNIEIARLRGPFEPRTIGDTQVFDSRKTIVKVGKFAQRGLVSGIHFPAEGLILFRCFFYVGGGKAIHLSQERVWGLGQIDYPRVKWAPFAFADGLRALMEDYPVNGLGGCLVVEPNFASC